MSDPGRQQQELRYGPSSATAHGNQSRVPAAVWPVLVLLVAAAVGVAVGAGSYAVGSSGSGDGWEELGAFLLGLALGVAAFAVTYVVGLVLAARRAFPQGSRALPFALSLTIPALLVAASAGLAALADAAGTDLPGALTAVAGLAALAAAPVAFACANSTSGRRRIAKGAAAVSVLMLAVTGIGIGLGRSELNRAAEDLPLVLFQGNTAAAPFDGWRRDDFTSIRITGDTGSIADSGRRAYLKYFTPEGVVFVTMHSDLGDCRTTPGYSCRVTGTLGGNEVRRYDRTRRYGSYPGSDAFDVLVFRDGSGVSVNDDPSTGRLRTTSTEVLQGLVRVDRTTFERATGAPLRLN